MYMYKAKTNKCYISKLVIDWKTWPNCVFFLTFLFCFVLFCFFSEQQKCQIWVGHSFEIWNLILDEQDTRQNTELKKSFVQSVSLCLSYLFLCILTSKFIKKLEKKVSKQKKFKPWILLNQTRTKKQTRAAALRYRIYFFSLSKRSFCLFVCLFVCVLFLFLFFSLFFRYRPISSFCN